MAGLDVFEGRIALKRPVSARVPRHPFMAGGSRSNLRLPDRVLAPGVSPFQDPGGAYLYLDDRDRAVVSVGRQIFVIAFRNGRWTRERLYALSAAIPADDRLN